MQFALQLTGALCVCATLVALAALPLGIKYALQVGSALWMALQLHLMWVPICVYASTILMLILLVIFTWVCIEDIPLSLTFRCE